MYSFSNIGIICTLVCISIPIIKSENLSSDHDNMSGLLWRRLDHRKNKWLEFSSRRFVSSDWPAVHSSICSMSSVVMEIGLKSLNIYLTQRFCLTNRLPKSFLEPTSLFLLAQIFFMLHVAILWQVISISYEIKALDIFYVKIQYIEKLSHFYGPRTLILSCTHVKRTPGGGPRKRMSNLTLFLSWLSRSVIY